MCVCVFLCVCACTFMRLCVCVGCVRRILCIHACANECKMRKQYNKCQRMRQIPTKGDTAISSVNYSCFGSETDNPLVSGKGARGQQWRPPDCWCHKE